MAALQLRDVPDDVHHELKMRAAKAGQSLSEHALAVLKAHAARPTFDEVAERIRERSAVEPTTSIGDLIHHVRDGRAS